MFKKLITLIIVFALVFCGTTAAFADTASGTDVNAQATTPRDVTNTDITDTNITLPDTTPTDVSGTDITETEEERAEREAAEAAAAEEAAKIKAAKEKADRYRNGLAAYIRTKNTKLSKSWSKTLAGYFIKAGEKYDLDPKVLMAIAVRESNFRAKAKSPYGYKGMMQTSDALARNYGYKAVSLYKAKVSIDVAARYMKAMKKRFGTYTKALCAYCYGSGAVAKGRYSIATGRKMMKTRDSIQEYLEKRDYI